MTRSSALAVLLAGAGSGVVTGSPLAQTRRSDGPYGPLGFPDAHGLRLPPGFTARVVARAGDTVDGSAYTWHQNPDGAACFPAPDGGFVYVSNSEVGSGRGGAGAIRFDAAGRSVDAYRILDGTYRNCAGGATPWGTWLSCEEAGAEGQVWECDPTGRQRAVARPALGSFNHEAAAIVESGRFVLLTEDARRGRLYRFVPHRWPDLSRGDLFAASVDRSGDVTWVEVATDRPDRSAGTTAFDGGEGIVVSGSDVIFSTKGDRRLWRYDVAGERIDVLHDCRLHTDTALSHVDNLMVDDNTGDLFVAEDGGNLELCLLTGLSDDRIEISPFLRLVGHDLSEITGPALNPARNTLLFSSQRGTDGSGMTFAVTGPFRTVDDTGLDRSTAATTLRRARRLSTHP